MLNRLVEAALRNRLLVLLVFAMGLGLGAWRLLSLPVDAFPDTTPIQVQINTVAPALNPEEIERQITLPVELAIGGLPGLANVRSVSKFGLSQVVATFDDTTSIAHARQFTSERLAGVSLPGGIDPPQLGPISSGLGEIFHYVVRSENPGRSVEELRTIHDWIIKPELRKVPGVAEVNTWGGKQRQYHVIFHPDALIKYDLTLRDIFEALELNNQNVGGGQIVSAGKSWLVHGLGRVSSIADIENIVISAQDGSPVYIRDVAEVAIGHEIRRGAVTAQGRGEVVLGLAFMLMGENSKDVTEELRARLDNVRKSLPDDVIIDIVYDRADLVSKVINTVRENLSAGAVLVVVVLFLLLGSLRAGLLVALTIPMAMLFAVLGMHEFSIAASLLSLGAIDFGILVDGSVVMTESNLRTLAAQQEREGGTLSRESRLQIVITSSQQVARPIVFGMGIIIVVFFPVLGLQGVEGKMFRPMAWTFIFALSGALLIALFLSPILSYYILPRNPRGREGLLIRATTAAYTGLLAVVLRCRVVLICAVVVLLGCTGWVASRIGGEFLPRLSEGSIAVNVIRLAGISLDESVRYNTRIEDLLLQEFPDEIEHVWSRIGTAEVATDPMGIELTDLYLTLKDRTQWTRATSQDELTLRLQEVLGDLPGLNMVFTQPIEMRMNELISGVRSDIAIKIYGDDFDELIRLSDDVQRILTGVDGASDISADQITGQPTLRIRVKPEQLARYGIPARNVLDFVETIGTRHVGEVFEAQRQFPLVVRLPDEYRRDVRLLADTLIPTEMGAILPLHMLASVEDTEGPATINREWGRRLIRVQCNVVGRDVASFVEEAMPRIENELSLPEGYVIEWGGQFENLERARIRLGLLVPLTLALVFVLLYFSLRSLRDALLIYTGVPFAIVGGVLALWWRGLPFSVSAAVGFIALTGIAVLNGQILIAAIRVFLQQGSPMREAVVGAAKQRLRPVLATAITDAAGFIPMAISTGVGAEVQRPLATVVIGGVLTSTLLTLFLLPVLYELAAGAIPLNRAKRPATAPASADSV
ncbi:MAG: efflux RND transporter permease subunit [Planctomycetes bacterium]|nr:efflux RND transporter permease subunit [Planctomycetota bacterium]